MTKRRNENNIHLAHRQCMADVERLKKYEIQYDYVYTAYHSRKPRIEVHRMMRFSELISFLHSFHLNHNENFLKITSKIVSYNGFTPTPLSFIKQIKEDRVDINHLAQS